MPDNTEMAPRQSHPGPLPHLAAAPAGRRQRTEALVDREYATARNEVLRSVQGKLRAAAILLDDADLEPAYNQAWHALYVKLAEGEEIENRTALLVTITYRRAIDDYRTMHVDRRAELDPALAATGVDVDARLDDQRRIRAVAEGMRERLNPRELQAATLCYLHDHTRPEAAEVLGLSPRRMEKVMDRVSKQIAAIVRDIEGGWCESRRSLVRAYAVGLLDDEGERHTLAVSHLADCPACRRRVVALRGLAGVTPPVPLVFGPALAAAGAIGGRTPAADAPHADPARPDSPSAGAASSAGGGTVTTGMVVAGVTGLLALAAVAGGASLVIDHRDSTAPATAPASAGNADGSRTAGAGVGDAGASPPDSTAADRAAGEESARRPTERRAAPGVDHAQDGRSGTRTRGSRGTASSASAQDRVAGAAGAATPRRPAPSDPSAATTVPSTPSPTTVPSTGPVPSSDPPSPQTAPSSPPKTSTPPRVSTDGAEEFGLR